MVPHLHRGMEESFFVLDGEFLFTVGGRQISAGPDDDVQVPRDTAHVLAAASEQARCLVLMVPGGQEDMFYELGSLGVDRLRDPLSGRGSPRGTTQWPHERSRLAPTGSRRVRSAGRPGR